MHNTLVSSTLTAASAALGFRWRRLRVRSAALWLSLVCMPGCYTLEQVYYQGNLLSTRKPNELLLWQASTPAKLKASLRQVEDIRAYAEKAGLAVGGAYGTYIASPHAAVSYVVQAADPLKLNAKQWWFPVIGKVPYLGYYYEEDRDKMAKQLAAEGYDVAKTEAGAFSSLGWYDDPVYSPMLRRPLHSLAHLFFHELTHRTFWIPNEAELNEHMAEFIGMSLTRQYLTDRGDQAALAEYLGWLADKKVYANWVKRMRDDLKALYAGSSSRADKLARKAAIFRRYTGEAFPKFQTKRYAYLKQVEWNNAVVLGASLYLPETEPFERAFACGQFKNVGSFLRALESKFDEMDAPALKVVESLCSESTLGPKGGA